MFFRFLVSADLDEWWPPTKMDLPAPCPLHSLGWRSRFFVSGLVFNLSRVKDRKICVGTDLDPSSVPHRQLRDPRVAGRALASSYESHIRLSDFSSRTYLASTREKVAPDRGWPWPSTTSKPSEAIIVNGLRIAVRTRSSVLA